MEDRKIIIELDKYSARDLFYNNNLKTGQECIDYILDNPDAIDELNSAIHHAFARICREYLDNKKCDVMAILSA